MPFSGQRGALSSEERLRSGANGEIVSVAVSPARAICQVPRQKPSRSIVPPLPPLPGEPWVAFTRFMATALEVGTGSLTLRFTGDFAPTEELQQAGMRGYAATQQLLDRAQTAGIIRADLTVADLVLLFEQLQAIRVGDHERTMQLRRRALALLLDALRCPDPPPLPGPAPHWEELRQRYEG